MNDLSVEMTHKAQYLVQHSGKVKGLNYMFNNGRLYIIYNDYTDNLTVFDGNSEVLTATKEIPNKFIDGDWVNALNNAYRNYVLKK